MFPDGILRRGEMGPVYGSAPTRISRRSSVKPVCSSKASARRTAGATSRCMCSLTSTSLWTQANSSS